jgi:hypothetical protein
MSINLPRIALAILFSISVASVATAQTPAASAGGALLPSTAAGGIQRLPTPGFVRVRARHFDSLLNGALIGAGAGVGVALFTCHLLGPWENCFNDYNLMLRGGMIGAGIGIGVDALLQRRWTIYETAPGSTTLRAAPMVGRRGAGLRLSFSF